MDSANSGSLQSSSGGGGGDEDYDSRTNNSLSSFLNHPSSNFNHNPILQPPQSSSSSSHHHHHHHHQTLDNNPNTTFFHNSYFAPSNPGYDNPGWSRNIRSDPNPTFTGLGGVQNDDVFLNNSQQTLYNPSNPNSNNHSPPVSSNSNPGRVFDQHHVGVTAKNPKKRTRASRRAPTTVLTTDTTNFRQMVQEFTGIPTAPFSAASPSPFSRRMDLFGGGSGGLRPVYPLRPSPEKIQPSISLVDGGSSSNYHLPPSDIPSFQNQPQSLLSSQNPLFSFQSLLQTKIPQQVSAPILGTTKCDDNQGLDIGSGFPSSSTRWRDQNENLVNFEGGNRDISKVDGYKLNSLDFDHQREKGLENVVSSRNGGDQTQGNVDSWLCPSD